MIPGLLFFLLNFSNLTGDIDIQKIINSATGDSAMEIAADSSFTNKTLKFNSGQTVYVRVASDVSGQTKRVLNLRDNTYNLIKTYALRLISSNPYVFTTSLPAPHVAGNYSLEAIVESKGSVVNLVKTIEVGGNGGNNSSVSVNINNQVNTGPSANSSTSEESPSTSFGTSEPTSEVFSNSGDLLQDRGFFASLWSKVVEFFKGIF